MRITSARGTFKIGSLPRYSKVGGLFIYTNFKRITKDPDRIPPQPNILKSVY